MNSDEEHLKLLSIFHYVVGGLAGLFACFPIFHVIMGVVMVTGGFGDGGQGPPAIMGWMFVIMGVTFMTFGWVLAGCLIGAAGCLRRKRRYMFCLVMGAISCMFMPFGTVLGVFTIIVLMRESVKELFAAQKETMVSG